MNPNRDLTSAAQSREGGALPPSPRSESIVIEKGERFEGGGIAGSRLNRESALSGSGAQHQRREALAPVLREPEALQAGGSENDRVHLAFGQLAQSRIDVTRSSRHSTSGRSAFSCACRRRLLVPMRAFCGSASKLAWFTETKASRGSTRSGIAAIVNGAASSVGRSFRLCTARSIRPAKSASSISLVNIPLPSPCAPATSANGTCCMVSPRVLMISIVTSCPAPRSRSAM